MVRLAREPRGAFPGGINIGGVASEEMKVLTALWQLYLKKGSFKRRDSPRQ
jgi:hypothetical protein